MEFLRLPLEDLQTVCNDLWISAQAPDRINAPILCYYFNMKQYSDSQSRSTKEGIEILRNGDVTKIPLEKFKLSALKRVYERNVELEEGVRNVLNMIHLCDGQIENSIAGHAHYGGDIYMHNDYMGSIDKSILHVDDYTYKQTVLVSPYTGAPYDLVIRVTDAQYEVDLRAKHYLKKPE